MAPRKGKIPPPEGSVKLTVAERVCLAHNRTVAFREYLLREQQTRVELRERVVAKLLRTFRQAVPALAKAGPASRSARLYGLLPQEIAEGWPDFLDLERWRLEPAADGKPARILFDPPASTVTHAPLSRADKAALRAFDEAIFETVREYKPSISESPLVALRIAQADLVGDRAFFRELGAAMSAHVGRHRRKRIAATLITAAVRRSLPPAKARKVLCELEQLHLPALEGLTAQAAAKLIQRRLLPSSTRKASSAKPRT